MAQDSLQNKERHKKEAKMEEEQLPNTLTPREETLSQQENNLAHSLPWGRLITCKKFLSSVDLVNPFSFGRSEDCSMIITGQTCPRNVLLNISKTHFRIEKNNEDNFVYITDLSKNGTFINKVKLGTGKKKILKHDDIIAIALPQNSIYVFVSLQVTEEFLPDKLRAKYANIKGLGRGSCGEVRLVKDRDTFHQYAVKKIVLGESNSSQIHKINHPSKIINEIEILRSLVHPCIIACEDIVECGREVYLVLEYMAGGELTRRILDYPVSEDRVKFFFLQMLYAVQYLHSHGVIHRDLKPENILLKDQRQETLLKITDFGLSKITNASDMTTMCGTLRFVAPEVLNHGYRDYGEYGKKVDVWSLGVILYFMLSKEYPFSGEENSILAKNIVKCSYKITGDNWSKISPEAKDLIRRILVVMPKRRYSVIDIINHPWIKNDYGVQYRVENLLQQEGLENPLQDLVLEPPEKKFKFTMFISSSSSSDELDSTLVFSETTSNSSGGSTICH